MTVQIDINAKDNTKAAWDSAASTAQAGAQKIKEAMNKAANAWVANQQSAKEIAAMNSQFYATKNAATSAASGISALSAASKFFMGTVLTAGTLRLAKQAYEFSRMGAEVDYTRIKFERLSNSIGTTGDAFLGQLRTATKGTISDFAAMKQGADLLQLGLAKDANEAVRLSRVMTALNMDTGELTLALANQSKRRLDQLGLSLTMFNKIEEKLKGQGLTKEEAFKQAFIQTAEQTVALTGNMADTKLGDYMRFEARNENLKAGLAEWVSSWAVRDTPYQGYAGNMAFTRGSADFAELARNPYTKNLPGNDLARQSSYEAMARYYMQPQGEGGLGGEGATLDYGMLLDGALKLTSANEKFAAAQADIEDKFKSSKYVAELYREEVNSITAAYRSGEISLTQYREQTKQLASDFKSGAFAKREKGGQIAQVEAGEQRIGAGAMLTAYAGMEGADPMKQLDLARNLGLVTEQAFNQQSAILMLAQAYDKGTLSANMAAKGVQKVMKFDGAYGSMTFDVFINYIISNRARAKMGAGGGGVSGGTGNTFAAQATGGLMEADVIELGERGWEYALKTEDGYVVIPHEESKVLKKYGLSSKKGMAGGGLIKNQSVFQKPSWMSNIGNRGGRNRSASGDVFGGGASEISGDSMSVSNILAQSAGANIAPQASGMYSSRGVDELGRVNENLEILIGKTASASDIGRAVLGKGMLQA